MSKTKKKRSSKRNYKKFIWAFWLLFLSGLIAVVGIFAIAAFGFMGQMPPLEQLENPKTNLATQILSSDEVVLGKFYFNDNRTPITFDELPKNIVEALIATEDERYYDHAGIDWRGTLRAIFYLGKKVELVPLPSSWPDSFLLGCAPATKKKHCYKRSRNGYCRFNWKDDTPKRRSSPCTLTSMILDIMPTG